MQEGLKRILIVGGIAALTVALYFAPHEGVKQEAKAVDNSSFSFEDELQAGKRRLKREEAEQISLLEAAVSKEQGSVTLLDSLGKTWDRYQTPAISSHYFEEVAKLSPEEGNWISAAYRYFDAFKMTGDSARKSYFSGKAIECYQKVLAINPKNLDAKTDLGVIYTEATANPMQGIMMLREVIAENPKHLMAQFNLGVLAVKSGQLDKAVGRFETVLTIDPKFDEARMLLARTYLQMNNNTEALRNLQILAKQSEDQQMIRDANSLINQINNH
ncbi:MAG: tetratricopeptide repeat protein [Bacteroidetes bacterium]|nr:tetratricopeptide repeat protein [Bacteroidota bacterium]